MPLRKWPVRELEKACFTYRTLQQWPKTGSDAMFFEGVGRQLLLGLEVVATMRALMHNRSSNPVASNTSAQAFIRPLITDECH